MSILRIYRSCISSLFYIKPQLLVRFFVVLEVVYLLFSTSNHNSALATIHPYNVVYLLFSTSNHNPTGSHMCDGPVVYLLFSTSNHNRSTPSSDSTSLYIFSFLHQTTTPPMRAVNSTKLYIFSFLHQTTTVRWMVRLIKRCISSLFYIKPQPQLKAKNVFTVVYLLFSTSNHNVRRPRLSLMKLYIFSFLHQTTT